MNRTGIRVSSLNCEFTPSDELVASIQQADAVLIGSPTLGWHAPTPIVSALGTLLAEGDRSKPVGVFGSFGWSGEAVDLLKPNCVMAGFQFGFDPIRVKFSPDAAKVKQLEEIGTRFARQLLKALNVPNDAASAVSAKAAAIPPSSPSVGCWVSLCVLTTRKGDLSGAMVASWVSQASFTPPGITVAVAKDRAVEALLHKGDRFALKCAGGRPGNRSDETVPAIV